MLRWGEALLFLAPLAAFIVWRRAVARGLEGLPPRQIVALLVGLLLMGVALIWMGEREGLPPGRYVPAAVVDGRIVPGHAE